MDPFRKLIKLKTLLVDDDELIRDAFSLVFMNKGCFLKTTGTAEEGLRALKEESFDIIISDLKLPGIDGLEFFRHATVSQPNTVKVLITAYGDENVVSRAFGIGVHDFIEKPFSIQKLITSLAMLVEKYNEMGYKADEKTRVKAKV
jgi:DNA-binding NtrC family response regulator